MSLESGVGSRENGLLFASGTYRPDALGQSAEEGAALPPDSRHPTPAVPGIVSGVVLLLLTATAVAAPVPVPQDTTDLRDLRQTVLAAPEELLFDVIWGGWGFNWINAGQATLDLLPTGNSKVWQIRSLAWGNSFFQTFYPVEDTVLSFINAKGVYPLAFHKILNEGSYRSRQRTDYDQKAGRVKTGDTTLTVAPFTHDVLSAFYYIRTQPLYVGKSFELSAVSGKKAYKLKVICHREETVEVPAGRFKTWVIEPVLNDDGLFKSKGRLWIWITRDDRRMPVKMQSKIPVGSIKAELVQVGPRS